MSLSSEAKKSTACQKCNATGFIKLTVPSINSCDIVTQRATSDRLQSRHA